MQGKLNEAPTLGGKLRRSGQRRFLAGLLIAASAIAASAVIVAPYYYSTPNTTTPGQIRAADDITIHLSVMEQFDKMLRSGSSYPRWLADANDGYGNAWPNFYQPGFYYLTSLVNAFTHNWINTLFIIAALGLAASALACYLLARMFFGKLASIIAAIVYGLLPYHLMDLFWRGAMPEYLSFALLPLVLYFFYKLGRAGRARDYAGLGFCYGLCLLIHLPIAYLFSYYLIGYGLAWAAAKRDWRIAARIAAGMTIGALLSAIYWLPALAEIKYATETVTQLFAYHNTYATVLQSEPRFDHLLRESFALQALALLALVAIWGLLNWRAAAGRTPVESATGFSLASGWIVMGLMALFMNLPESYFLARLIPKIEVVAFPWRWMVFMCLFTALLAAAIVDRVMRKDSRAANGKPVALIASVAMMVIFAFNIGFAVQGILIGSLANPMVTPGYDLLSDTYCPKGAPPVDSLPRTDLLTIQSKAASSEVTRWEPLAREAVINADEATAARFKTFNFPGWTARLDGVAVPIASDPVGAQLINVPPGRHTIEIRFGGTLPRALGAMLSGFGLLLIGGLALTGYLWPSRQSKPVSAIADAKQATGGALQERFTRRAAIKRLARFGLWGIVLAGGVRSIIVLINEMSFTDPSKPDD